MFDMATEPETAALLGDASFEACGIRIQSIREVAGLTQSEFASALGTTYSVVGNWERGESLPRHHMLIAMCEIYNVSADFILRGYVRHFTLEDLDRYTPVLARVSQDRRIKSAGKRAREQLKQQLEHG